MFKRIAILSALAVSMSTQVFAAHEAVKSTLDSVQINRAELWPKPQNYIARGSENSPALKVVQSFFEAYGKGDMAALQQFVADDVEWHIPGKHPLAGTKRGVVEFTEFFTELGKAGFQAQVMILAANDTYVIDAHRGFSNTQGQNIDINWVLLYQIEEGKIKRVQNFSGDQYSSDAFFTQLFSQSGK